MAYLTNFSFEFFYEIFTEDASLLFLYHGAKKSKMTKNSNQGGGPALKQLTEPASCSSVGREFQIRGARLEKDTVPEVEEERYGT